MHKLCRYMTRCCNAVPLIHKIKGGTSDKKFPAGERSSHTGSPLNNSIISESAVKQKTQDLNLIIFCLAMYWRTWHFVVLSSPVTKPSVTQSRTMVKYYPTDICSKTARFGLMFPKIVLGLWSSFVPPAHHRAETSSALRCFGETRL